MEHIRKMNLQAGVGFARLRPQGCALPGDFRRLFLARVFEEDRDALPSADAG
jgi:hypothetical protein